MEIFIKIKRRNNKRKEKAPFEYRFRRNGIVTDDED